MQPSANRPSVLGFVLALVVLAAWLGCESSARAASAAECVEALASFPEPASAGADDDTPQWLCPLGEPQRVSDDEIPICLIEGASAVAPLPIHSIGDARIEASQRCNDLESSGLLAPPDEPQRRLSQDSPGAALLPVLPAVEGGIDSTDVTAAELERGAPRGYRVGVYRPPRG